MAHGWAIYLSREFVEQVNRLADAHVTARRQRGDITEVDKVLAAVVHLAFDVIPSDPARPEYRMGNALGARPKHWFRAKFGNGRFRLFFRFHKDSRVVILAWVNDAKTLRTYGSHTDAYAVFRQMLAAGHPPDDWDALLREAASPEVAEAARKLISTRLGLSN